jgi:hypothetical protein
MRALPGNTELSSNVRHRTVTTNHPFDEQDPAMNVESGISVGHENLRKLRR